MRYTITVNNTRVAYFENFRNSRGICDILREYVRYAEPWRCSTLFLEGQKIVTCYYPRNATRNPDRSKWRPIWEDANGKRISAKEALEKVKAAREVL